MEGSENDYAEKEGSESNGSEDETYVLQFGKHGGKKLSEVPPSYLAWLRNNEDTLNCITPTLIEALDEYFESEREKLNWTPLPVEFLTGSL